MINEIVFVFENSSTDDEFVINSKILYEALCLIC